MLSSSQASQLWLPAPTQPLQVAHNPVDPSYVEYAQAVSFSVPDVSPAPMSTVAETVPSKNNQAARRHHHHHHHRRRHHPSGASNSGRLWQLPEASIQNYANWIESKPKESRSPGEIKFLQTYQRRILIQNQKRPSENMKQYIGRLESKEDPSEIELQLIQKFHRRRTQRRALKRGPYQSAPPVARRVPPPIFWKRHNNKNKSSSIPTSSTNIRLLGSMVNLQESMDRMGLSADKLRQAVSESNTPFAPVSERHSKPITIHRSDEFRESSASGDDML